MTNMDREKEIREARAAGVKALNTLRRAQGYLNSARNWGIYDMLGGGLISSLVKHSKMDDAARCVREAQRDLRAFSRELGDVNLPGVEIGDFTRFADVFLDSFIADIMAQRRINEAREQVDRACRRVEDILRRLR